MKNNLFFLIVFSFLTSCKYCKESKESETYTIKNELINDDCNLYGMIFNEGDYLFRFAPAGNCNSINYDQYITVYHNFLNHNFLNHNFKEDKFIRLEFYKNFQINTTRVNEIKKVTQNVFKKKIKIVKTWEEGLELKIFAP